jgi:hypothetical protein
MTYLAACKECELILENLSRSIAGDFDQLFDAATVKVWSTKVIEAAMDNEKVKKRAHLSEEIATRKPDESPDSSDQSFSESLAILDKHILSRLEGFDASDTQIVKKIRKMLEV